MRASIVELAGKALSDDPDEGLAAVAALRRQIEDIEYTHVSQALRSGWSWSDIGEALGVTKQAAHSKHGDRPLAPPPEEETHRLVVSGDARLAVFLGRSEAAARHDRLVGTEHLLLGLLQQGDGRAAEALGAVGVTLKAARMQADQFSTSTGSTDEADPSRLPLSGGAREALEQAMREVVRRGDDKLCTEHLLLALLREPESCAVQVLAGLGIAPADIEKAVG